METPEYASFEIFVRPGDDSVVLDLRGEFDMSEVDPFRACIDGVIGSAEGAVVIDLGDVTFIDSSAISALLSARERLADQNRALQLRHTASVARVFELAGLADLLDNETDAGTHQPRAT
jgi:anti-sigma B factor antagonist